MLCSGRCAGVGLVSDQGGGRGKSLDRGAAITRTAAPRDQGDREGEAQERQRRPEEGVWRGFAGNFEPDAAVGGESEASATRAPTSGSTAESVECQKAQEAQEERDRAGHQNDHDALFWMVRMSASKSADATASMSALWRAGA